MNNKPRCTLWFYLEERYSFDFSFFIEKIVEYCFKNLYIPNKNLIKITLEILGVIYQSSLSKEKEFSFLLEAG